MKKSKVVRSRTHKSKKPSLNLRNLIIGLFAFSAVVYFMLSRLPKPTPIGINEVAVSDASKITPPVLTQGDFLTDKLGTAKVQNGRIFFVYVIPLGETGKTGIAKLATLKFKPSGDSQISFGSNTMVAAIGQNNNVLKSATGTSIQTGESSATPAIPPVLTDIQKTPRLASPATEAQKSGSKAKVTPSTPVATSERVFNESGNFDYSRPAVVDESAGNVADSAPTSAFARFLALIKSFFGGKNVQN